jgi:hypothetical protein
MRKRLRDIDSVRTALYRMLKSPALLEPLDFVTYFVT